MKIAIGSDHAGFQIKEYLKKEIQKQDHEIVDFGAFSEESIDYPDIAHLLTKSVQDKQFTFGILICGSGNGMAIVANKYYGIRAALCWNPIITKLARQHNDANILVLPGRFINEEEAKNFTTIFLNTLFEGGRHQRRVMKISVIL